MKLDKTGSKLKTGKPTHTHTHTQIDTQTYRQTHTEREKGGEGGRKRTSFFNAEW